MITHDFRFGLGKTTSTIIILSISLFITIPPSHVIAQTGTTLISNWTWDEPILDGNFEQLWSETTTYTFSIFNYDDVSNQTFTMKFLNNENFIFIGVTWNDDYLFSGDSIAIYFDESHDGVLSNSQEDSKYISHAGILSLGDRYWDDGWVSDSNQTILAAGGFSSFEFKLPIGSNADSEDLDLLHAGDIVGFGLIAQDREFEGGNTGTWPDNDPTQWADLQLSIKPILDFPVDIETSINVPQVGEVFYLLTTISNMNGTGTVYYIVATLFLPDGISRAPGVPEFIIIEELYSAQYRSSGYNYTCLWTLIADSIGEYSIELVVDGFGVPELSVNIQISVVSNAPVTTTYTHSQTIDNTITNTVTGEDTVTVTGEDTVTQTFSSVKFSTSVIEERKSEAGLPFIIPIIMCTLVAGRIIKRRNVS
jgi:hypothetical protein